jgi:ABC-type transport system involved in cytochrome bd biosynthesis fused ATPase/permease subunit
MERHAPGPSSRLWSLLVHAWRGIALLALLQLVWLLAVPVTIFAVGTRMPMAIPLVVGGLFAAVQLLFQQSLRRRLRTACMVHAARTALTKSCSVPEASIDSAFWSAHLAEYAVSVTAPAMLAAAGATACILALATVRLGLQVVLPVTAVLALAAVAGLLTHRRLGRHMGRVIDTRTAVATWMAAAVRDAGELAGAVSREPFLARVHSEAAAWCLAEDRYERRRALSRLSLGVGVVAALLAAASFGGLELLTLAAPDLRTLSLHALVDAALFVTSLPAAYSLARQVDAMMTAHEELRQLEPPTAPPRPDPSARLPQRPMRLLVRDLVARYGEHVALRIQHLDLSLERPVALVGVNGAGKTTFAAILAGVLSPSEGTMTLDGLPTDTIDRSQVAYVPQDPVLIESLTIGENVRLVAPEASDEAIAATLRSLGLSRAPTDAAGSLSRGERRRIAVARALLKDPRLLILDEPDAWLDATGREALLAVLHTEATRRAVVLVTHRADMAPLAETVVLLSPAHALVTVGTPDELQRTSGAYRRVLHGADEEDATGT